MSQDAGPTLNELLVIVRRIEATVDALALARTAGPELLSKRATRKLLGVSAKTVEDLVRTQQLRPVRGGKRLRIPRIQVERMLAEGEAEPSRPAARPVAARPPRTKAEAAELVRRIRAIPLADD